MLEDEDAVLPRTTVLRCRVRYFTDGAVLGSSECVCGLLDVWQREARLRRAPKPCELRGADWKGLSVIRGCGAGCLARGVELRLSVCLAWR